MNKKLLYLPLICITLLSLIGFIVFKTVLSNWFNDYMLDELRSELNALTDDIQQLEQQEIHRFISDAAQRHAFRRLTLIANNGTVLADSSTAVTGLSSIDNHRQRPEVELALKNGEGHSTRLSQTLRSNMMYVARATSYQDQAAVLRIATPLSYIESLARELELLFIALLAHIIFATGLLTILVNRNTQKLITKELLVQQEQISERTREVELLHRLANMLAACNSIAEAQQVVEDIIPRILGELNGAIALIRSSRNQLEVKLDWGGTWPGMHSYTPDECWALRKGKYHLANDHYTTLPCSHMHSVGDDQTLCIPLIAHGNSIGLMHLYLRDKDFSPEQTQLAFTIAEHLGLALANLNLQEKLREQAIRDPLTGLYNRRFLEESIQHEILRAKRHQHKVSVLAIDVDHFKRFNDNFGHDAGDYVLKSLSNLLTETMRGEDVVCRTGGEELNVLLINTDSSQAITVANKLCHIVREMHLEFHGVTLGKLTISIGVATFPDDSDEIDSLLKIADTALYKAKENGRDQCVYCGEKQEPDNNGQNIIDILASNTEESTS